LVRLRWVAAAGQLLAIGVATQAFGATLPTSGLLALVGLGAASNAALALWPEHRWPAPPARLVSVLIFDTASLTAMLALSGGASNPFSVFYLVHVVLAALLLDARATVLLAVVTSLGFGALFALPAGEHDHHAMMMHGDFSSHLQGMWISYTLAAVFIGYFVWRLARALEDRERQLEALRRGAARAERLASLSDLAAGAAHELGSPLATIAVVAGELGHVGEGAPVDAAAVREDAALLRGEAERCRRILERLAARSGEALGEAPALTTTGEVIADVRQELGRVRGERLRVDDPRPSSLRAPRRALVQSLLNLVNNAFDAIDGLGEAGRVTLRVTSGAAVTWTVVDNGTGPAPGALERLGEPFYTTKPPGRGMGLGLFLVGSFAERLGGRLELGPGPDGGMEAELSLPRGAP
ncbi:MAG: HAMP domain-containing histidine kinase, partial [Myxococcales bacterium]